MPYEISFRKCYCLPIGYTEKHYTVHGKKERMLKITGIKLKAERLVRRQLTSHSKSFFDPCDIIYYYSLQYNKYPLNMISHTLTHTHTHTHKEKINYEVTRLIYYVRGFA